MMAFTKVHYLINYAESISEIRSSQIKPDMESSNLAIKRFLSTFTNIILFEEPVLHSDILKYDFFFHSSLKMTKWPIKEKKKCLTEAKTI